MARLAIVDLSLRKNNGSRRQWPDCEAKKAIGGLPKTEFGDMRKMIVSSLCLAVMLGIGAVHAEDAQLPNANAQRVMNSALAAAALGASRADELRLQHAQAARNGGTPGAFKSALTAAERGDLDAQLQVGTMYAQGNGVRRNDTKALDWFVKAAVHGGPARQMASDRLTAILRARGVPEEHARSMAALALMGRAFGAGTRRPANNHSSTFAEHMMMHEFLLGD